MKRSIKALGAGLGLALSLSLYPGNASGQQAEGPDRSLAKAKLLYDSGRYQDSFNELVALLGRGNEYDPKIMVEIYKYLAFDYCAYDRRDLSKKQFKNAFKYDPNLELDPIFTSPIIMETFSEAKKEFLKEKTKDESKVENIPHTDVDEFKSGDTYKSEVIMPDYGFKVVKKSYGSIKETDYPKINEEEGYAYIVGYSLVCATEEQTKRFAKEDVEKKAIKMGIVETIGQNIILSHVEQVDNEMWEVEKEGKTGYVSHTVFKIPISRNKKANKSGGDSK